MTDSRMSSFEDAHGYFAKQLNAKVWELLQKTDRSKSEDELMVHAAHASCYHWLSAGDGLNQQRSEWLVAHVYTVLGMPESAVRHAKKCLELTQQFPELLKDYDRAYAQECMARGLALAGNREEAKNTLPRPNKSAKPLPRRARRISL